MELIELELSYSWWSQVLAVVVVAPGLASALLLLVRWLRTLLAAGGVS